MSLSSIRLNTAHPLETDDKTGQMKDTCGALENRIAWISDHFIILCFSSNVDLEKNLKTKETGPIKPEVRTL